MKKVINGKVYDTETAKRKGEYEPSPYKRDFHWFCETLYQKKTGEFFIHGVGNAASKYSQTVSQNEWCGGETIIPLSYEQAQKWAEEHLSGDDYITIFGDPEEDETKQAVTIRLSKVSYTKAKQYAAKHGISLQTYIESLIKEA